MKKLLTILIFFILTIDCYCQNDSISEEGFYIPKNIIECNEQLDIILSKKAKEKIKQVDENKLHKISYSLVFGQWFETDSTRLTDYFKKFSINRWYDHEKLIKLAYCRHLNNKPFDIEFECKKINDEKALKAEQRKILILKDSIYGIYIPSDLKSCFAELDKIYNDTIKQQLKANNLDLYLMHLGRWMRNDWQLWNGSRLKTYFINRKVTNAENISSIIIEGYIKYLNHEDIDADQFINNKRIEQEEWRKNIIVDSTPAVVNKKNYSKEYKKFIRTRKIKDIEIYDW